MGTSHSTLVSRLQAWHIRRTEIAFASRYAEDKPGLRRCSRRTTPECRQREGWWPITDYAVQKKSCDGLHPNCPTCRRTTSRSWKERNRQHCRDYAKTYAAQHPEQVRKKQRQWKLRNPIRNRIHARLYKYRKNQAGILTDEMWNAVVAFYGPRCLCCGKKRKLTIDHVVPLTCGGKNTRANVQPLCGRCNNKKGQKTTDYRPDYGRHWHDEDGEESE